MKKPLAEPRLDAPDATGKKPVQPSLEVVLNTIEYEGPAEKKKITAPPPALTGQFTLVANRYYFKERPDQEAFVDHGERLRTRHNRVPVAKAMLDLAESRGWDTIKVNGHPQFKQAVWLEASLKGMSVTGYAPTPQDQAALRTRQQEQGQATIRPSVGPTPAPAASPTPAPAAPAGSVEWYAARRERFSAAKEQAAQQRESRQAAVRDQVMEQVRAERRQQEAQAQAEQRRQVQQQEKAVQLREAVDTLDKRSAMERFPELARLYPLLAEAENFAKAHLRPENQPEFIEQIKERSLQELARGETLPKLPNVAEKVSSQDRSRQQAAEIEP